MRRHGRSQVRKQLWFRVRGSRFVGRPNDVPLRFRVRVRIVYRQLIDSFLNISGAYEHLLRLYNCHWRDDRAVMVELGSPEWPRWSWSCILFMYMISRKVERDVMLSCFPLKRRYSAFWTNQTARMGECIAFKVLTLSDQDNSPHNVCFHFPPESINVTLRKSVKRWLNTVMQ